jgi:hypothetical protein
MFYSNSLLTTFLFHFIFSRITSSNESRKDFTLITTDNSDTLNSTHITDIKSNENDLPHITTDLTHIDSTEKEFTFMSTHITDIFKTYSTTTIDTDQLTTDVGTIDTDQLTTDVGTIPTDQLTTDVDTILNKDKQTTTVGKSGSETSLTNTLNVVSNVIDIQQSVYTKSSKQDDETTFSHGKSSTESTTALLTSESNQPNDVINTEMTSIKPAKLYSKSSGESYEWLNVSNLDETVTSNSYTLDNSTSHVQYKDTTSPVQNDQGGNYIILQPPFNRYDK